MDDDHDVTPAGLRALAAEAEAFALRLAEVRDKLRQVPERERVTAFRVDTAAGYARQAAGELRESADAVARARAARGACAAHHGTCPTCGPAGLSSSGGSTVCSRCGTRWGYDRLKSPCAEPVTFRVVGAEGGEGILLCQGHAEDARVRLVGAVLTPFG
ncbi:hypothetical protein [Kitasatospora sp. NPDC002965]|uniref:hypothetical protein n=1 Tax=Kitasatospora sp. NPDC002965 TaxID=3154775 RepID=UPI0033BC7F36